MSPKIKKTFALLSFIEPLETLSSFSTRRMFGCLAIYVHDKNQLVLAENQDDPDWNGVLVPTDRVHHESLMKELQALQPHAILGKWLYVPMSHGDFEMTLEKLVQAVKRNDARIGIIPQQKRIKKAARKPIPKKR